MRMNGCSVPVPFLGKTFVAALVVVVVMSYLCVFCEYVRVIVRMCVCCACCLLIYDLFIAL